MKRVWAALPTLALALGCAGRAGPAREPTPPEPAPRPAPCTAVDTARGNRAFERARPFLELLTREEHPRTEVFERGLADLEEGATNGQLEAQYKLGATLFGFLFTDHAPEPKDRADYVKAFVWLRVAALRGHRAALTGFPGLDRPKLDAAVLAEQPLDSVPRAWLAEAFKKADDWLACAPPEAKTRYQAPPPVRRPTRLEKTESGWTKRGDPEGPLLRVSFAADSGAPVEPPLRTRLLASLPAVFDCYAELLLRDSEAAGEISLTLAKDGSVGAEGAGDEKLRACAKAGVEALGLAASTKDSGAARLDVELFPHALHARDLPDARDASAVERWEADGSCWGMAEAPPCPPRKTCPAPERIRVRCPRPGE